MFAMLIYNLLIYSVIREQELSLLHPLHRWLCIVPAVAERLCPQIPVARLSGLGQCRYAVFHRRGLSRAVTFARSFLQLKTQAPNLDLLGKIPWSIFLFRYRRLAVSVLQPDDPGIATATALAAAFYEFVQWLMVWRGQLRQARYFLLAWTALLLGIVMYALKTFNIVPANFATEYGLQIGSTMEVILLSFALAHRMKILQSDYTRIQEEAKNQLEQRVLQRTSNSTIHCKLSDANSKLRSLNFTDGLTGVRNRKYFDQKNPQGNGSGHSAAAISPGDADRSGPLQEDQRYLWHCQAGDLCLKSVASTVQSTLKRPYDVVARYGGEEFVW